MTVSTECRARGCNRFLLLVSRDNAIMCSIMINQVHFDWLEAVIRNSCTPVHRSRDLPVKREHDCHRSARRYRV